MAKKKEAPTVTIEEVKASIKDVTYTVLPNGRTTVCQITMDNGFTREGSSACVSLDLYDQAKGEKYSYERALDKVWEVLGFRLADRLHQAKMRKARGVRYRDSESGLYVPKAYALLSPLTTEKER